MEINSVEQANDLLSIHGWSHTQISKDVTYKVLQKAIGWKNLDLEAKARQKYYAHLIFLNEIDEAIVQYAWLLNHLKKHQNSDIHVDSLHIIWGFKWIIHHIPGFASIPLSKIEELWLEFKDLYKANRSGEKVIDYYGALIFQMLGEPQKSLEAYGSYKSGNSEGRYDDCLACQKDTMIEYHNYFGNFKESAKQNSKVGGKNFTCSEVPQVTYPKLCFANLMLGDFSVAENFYQLTMQKLGLKKTHIDLFQNIIYYLAVKKDFKNGVKVIESQFPAALLTTADFRLFHFYHSCHYFFTVMANEGHKKVKIKLPGSGIKSISENEYSLEEMINWLNENMTKHMARLDNRNSNTFWNDYMKRLDKQLAGVSVNYKVE
ncbi:MAG: hypothetical protein K0S32_629 [Bacteroidetes bacterium]|jgi:hypothetical protein|nr:hypothetical protein [Bacteroidota bacterium]